MSQVHETLAREWLAMCERKERVPLTVWETEQLLHGWLDRERLTRELGETNEALAARQSRAAGELRVLWLLKQNLAAWVARLAKQLPIDNPHRNKATQFLRAHGLVSILRDDAAMEAADNDNEQLRGLLVRAKYRLQDNLVGKAIADDIDAALAGAAVQPEPQPGGNDAT